MELKFHPDPAHKLSANLYDIYHCCVYSGKLLMMGRELSETCRVSFQNKNFQKLVRLVGYIISSLRFSLFRPRPLIGTNLNLLHNIKKMFSESHRR